MPTPQELEAKLWKALKSDMTLMLGLSGADRAHTRPMTAQIEGDKGPLWFFATRDSELAQAVAGGAQDGLAVFVSKDHDIFACIHGALVLDTDPAVIDRLWNSHVAAWYEGGKTDPKLALLRFDGREAEIWENASSLLAGIKSIFGSDPKEDFRDKVAEVSLS